MFGYPLADQSELPSPVRSAGVLIYNGAVAKHPTYPQRITPRYRGVFLITERRRRCLKKGNGASIAGTLMTDSTTMVVQRSTRRPCLSGSVDAPTASLITPSNGGGRDF